MHQIASAARSERLSGRVQLSLAQNEAKACRASKSRVAPSRSSRAPRARNGLTYPPEEPRPSPRNWLSRREMQVHCIKNDRPEKRTRRGIAHLTSTIFCGGIHWPWLDDGLFPEVLDECLCQHIQGTVHHVFRSARPLPMWRRPLWIASPLCSAPRPLNTARFA
jgi:hypothetical protein